MTVKIKPHMMFERVAGELSYWRSDSEIVDDSIKSFRITSVCGDPCEVAACNGRCTWSENDGGAYGSTTTELMLKLLSHSEWRYAGYHAPQETDFELRGRLMVPNDRFGEDLDSWLRMTNSGFRHAAIRCHTCGSDSAMIHALNMSACMNCNKEIRDRQPSTEVAKALPPTADEIRATNRKLVEMVVGSDWLMAPALDGIGRRRGARWERFTRYAAAMLEMNTSVDKPTPITRGMVLECLEAACGEQHP